MVATNKDLRAVVAARLFREDLYFRLSVFPITIPPLRDRGEDVQILARYFIDRFCKDLKKPATALSPQAEEALRQYRWPGNVRELQNCIERAGILCETSEIRSRHLSLVTDPDGGHGQPADPWDLLNLSETLEESSRRIHAEFEQHKIAQVMRDVNGDPPLVAARLKISHQDLLGKLKRYQLD